MVDYIYNWDLLIKNFDKIKINIDINYFYQKNFTDIIYLDDNLIIKVVQLFDNDLYYKFNYSYDNDLILLYLRLLCSKFII